MDYQRYIVRAPAICGGEPVIKGTRVPLRTILASLAAGDTPETILQDFPTLTEQDIRAAIAFAAAAAASSTPGCMKLKFDLCALRVRQGHLLNTALLLQNFLHFAIIYRLHT